MKNACKYWCNKRMRAVLLLLMLILMLLLLLCSWCCCCSCCSCCCCCSCCYFCSCCCSCRCCCCCCAGDIWQISGSPVAAATGGRRWVSGRTLGTISAIKRSFRRRIIISCADTRIRARPSSPFKRQYAALIYNWVGTTYIAWRNKRKVQTHT